MRKRRSVRIALTYALSLAVVLAMLVVWVVYVVRSSVCLNELASRAGVMEGDVHWIVLTVGCVLFFLLIGGITYQLAQSVAERRYSLKQEEFLSNVTHELRSPLAVIKLYAQTLEREGFDPWMWARSLGFIL